MFSHWPQIQLQLQHTGHPHTLLVPALPVNVPESSRLPSQQMPQHRGPSHATDADTAPIRLQHAVGLPAVIDSAASAAGAAAAATAAAAAAADRVNVVYVGPCEANISGTVCKKWRRVEKDWKQKHLDKILAKEHGGKFYCMLIHGLTCSAKCDYCEDAEDDSDGNWEACTCNTDKATEKRQKKR